MDYSTSFTTGLHSEGYGRTLFISFMFLIIKILRILKILDPKSLTWKAFLVICD